MVVLSEDDLIRLLPALQIVAAVEATVRAQEARHVVAPKRLHVQWDGHTLLTMPTAESDLGVKVISVVPGNTALRVPVVNGEMILNDSETGIPLAIVNAAALTAQRSGAVGALGVKYLTPQETLGAGIVDCGAQGAWQAIFACVMRPIKEVFVCSGSMAGFEHFAATVSRHAPGACVTSCQNARELLERTDLVMTATTAENPVLPDEPTLLENKRFISVGSYRPTLQEFPDAVYRRARCLAVDSEHDCHEVGDVIHPLRRGLHTETDVFSIAESVAGKRTLDTAPTTRYESVGLAIYDRFVAQALYRDAKSQGIGGEIAL